MIDSKTVQQTNQWNMKIDMNSEIEKSEFQQYKNQDEKLSTNEDNFNSDKMISFQEVISSNLSNIYQDISQNASNLKTQKKIQLGEFIEKVEPFLTADNGKCLLPVDSNITPENIERLTFRKTTLLMTSNLTSEKAKTYRSSKQKFQEKENTSVEPATQKHVRIKSQNVIKYFPEQEKQTTQPEQRNPQSSFENAEKLFTQLSRQFQYIGDFSLIRKEIVELALSKNLTIMQNTNEFVTIKVSSKLDYCQCLFKSCFNMQESGGIYQLKNSIYKRNKAKFIMISGNQKGFLKFFRNMLIKLWNHKQLKLKKNELVEFFVNAEKQDQSMKDLKKQYTKLYNEFCGLSLENKSSKTVSQSVISSLTDNFKRLRSPQKRKSTDSDDKFKKLLEYNEKVNKKLTELRSKLFSLQNSSDLDQQSIEKELQTEIYFHQFPVWKLFGFFYRTDYESYNLRKQQILKDYSMRKLFSFLQIQEQYSLFTVQKGRRNAQNQTQFAEEKMKSCHQIQKEQQSDSNNSNKVSSSEIKTKIPYQECIKLIESIGSSSLIPSKFMQKLEQFYNQLQTSYSQLYAQKPVLKLSSMDDQLPITIFIMLMAGFNGSQSVALNIVGKIKWLLKWIEHQQSRSEVQFDNSKPSVQGRQGFTLQKKVLTMLQAAILFITKQWKDQETKNRIE